MNMTNIDPSLPSIAPAAPATPAIPPAHPTPAAATSGNLVQLGLEHIPLPNSLASLLHPRPPVAPSIAPNEPSPLRPSSSRPARCPSSADSHDSDGHTTSDSESDHSENNYQDSHSLAAPSGSRTENGNDTALVFRSAKVSSATPDRLNTKKRKPGTQSSQRKRRSFRSSNTSVDPLALAHAVALIQSQQPANSYYGSGQSSLLPGLGASTATHGNNNAPPGSRLGSSGQQQSFTGLEIVARIEAATSPLRTQISNLKSQVEALDRQRIATAREMASLKDLLVVTARKVEALSGNARLPIEDEAIAPPSAFDPLIACARARTPPAISHTSTLDIPVVLPSTPLQTPFPDRRLCLANGRLDDGSSGRPLVNHNQATPASQTAATILSQSQPSRFDSNSRFGSEEPFRRAGSVKKIETPPGLSFTNPHSLINKTKKHRRPELSRTVRATVFRLMGICSNASPSASVSSTPHEPKFGNEKSRAYHGYTTTPCFPEYSNEDLIDPVTKTKIWRWDWSRTIRQSANNTAFAKEIRNVIVQEVEDPTKVMHSDVPVGDWEYLDDAIDSAYTNMRRERENQIDPMKMVKKEVHRARNKKRGLKEDKCKRRRKALDEYRSDPNAFAARLKELKMELADQPSGATRNGVQNTNEDGEKHVNSWDECLDLRYMSSEDEHNAQDFDNPVIVGPDRPDSSLSLSDKIFAICRPEWRSAELQNFFSVLDAIKQPERAYRRVLGNVRQTHPSPGTPIWMINPDWTANSSPKQVT